MEDSNFFDQIYFILTGMAKAYPILFPFATTMHSILNENTLGLMLAVLSVITAIFNTLLKKIAELYYKNNYIDEGLEKGLLCNSFWLRPDTNPNKNKKKPQSNSHGCGIFTNCKEVLPSPPIPDKTACLDELGIGMPSGHAQISTAMTFLLMMIIWAKGKLSYQIPSTIFLIIFALGTMWDRVLINCHSWLQVLIGSFIGYLSGIGYYYFLKWMYPDQLIEINTWWKHLIMWGYPILLFIIILVTISI